MSQTVAGILVDVLEKIGVTHIFGLIADSLNPIGDAVRHSKIEWIGVRHEEGAALAAPGQAKLTGRLGVCCGSTGPGSTHLVAGLYEANRDHAPVLAISGDMPRQLEGIDYFQATSPNMLFRCLALYRDRYFASAGAGTHSSGYRHRLCRPWRRAFDSAHGRSHRNGGWQRCERRHA